MTWVPDWSTGDGLYEEVEDEQEAADLESTEQGFDQTLAPPAPTAWEAEVDRFVDETDAKAEAAFEAYEARTYETDSLEAANDDEDGDEA